MYKAILFSLCGDFVTDYESETKEGVIEKLVDRGSQWYFYPVEGIIASSKTNFLKKRVMMEWLPEQLRIVLSGKSVSTISKYLETHEDFGYAIGIC